MARKTGGAVVSIRPVPSFLRILLREGSVLGQMDLLSTLP